MICVSLSLLSGLVGSLSYFSLVKTQKSYEQVTNVELPNLINLNNMFLQYRAVRINLRTLGLPGLPASEEQAAVSKVQKSIEAYEAARKEYLAVDFLPGEEKLFNELDQHWQKFKQIGASVLEYNKTGTAQSHEKMMQIFFKDCPETAALFTTAMNALMDFHLNTSKSFVQNAKQTADTSNKTIAVVCLFSILSGIFAALTFASIFTKSIGQVVAALNENATQVAAASKQIAESSQSLSQATTEQAASLEETAASIEEMSAMVTKNSENAKNTASNSEQSQEKAQHGQEAMNRMRQSMDEINQSNESIMNQINHSNVQMAEIVKVIQEIGQKTQVINDIVFQTKLLSFNASVEAARAGEHGKGFAVVAEEVGNLAQMSGNAAKEISDMLNASTHKVESIVKETKTKVESLIEEGKLKVNQGISVAEECAQVLNDIVHNTSNVSMMAGEISSATQEQAQGISEINKAVGQLDQVTQQNASTSEVTSGYASQLANQSQSLTHSIHNLMQILYGDDSVQDTTNHQNTHPNWRRAPADIEKNQFAA